MRSPLYAMLEKISVSKHFALNLSMCTKIGQDFQPCCTSWAFQPAYGFARPSGRPLGSPLYLIKRTFESKVKAMY